MEKRDFIKLLDEIFRPLGFGRKGNSWVLNGDELSKVVNLQKSNYSNAFYINYGYIIKGLELTTVTHVESRLASTDRAIQKKVTDLLDLEVKMDIDHRLVELREFIVDKIVTQMLSINTEKDLLNYLKRRPHLNDVSLVVKKYFQLE